MNFKMIEDIYKTGLIAKYFVDDKQVNFAQYIKAKEDFYKSFDDKKSKETVDSNKEKPKEYKDVKTKDFKDDTVKESINSIRKDKFIKSIEKTLDDIYSLGYYHGQQDLNNSYLKSINENSKIISELKNKLYMS